MLEWSHPRDDWALPASSTGGQSGLRPEQWQQETGRSWGDRGNPASGCSSHLSSVNPYPPLEPGINALSHS